MYIYICRMTNWCTIDTFICNYGKLIFSSLIIYIKKLLILSGWEQCDFKITHCREKVTVNCPELTSLELNYFFTYIVNWKQHGFSCDLEKQALMSFSDTSNSTRPAHSCYFDSLQISFVRGFFPNCTRNHAIIYTNVFLYSLSPLQCSIGDHQEPLSLEHDLAMATGLAN